MGGCVSEGGRKLDFEIEISEKRRGIQQAPTLCVNEFDISLDFLNSPSMVKLFPLGDKETKTLRYISYLESHGWMTTQPDSIVRHVSITKSLLATQHHSVAGNLSYSQIMGYSAQ